MLVSCRVRLLGVGALHPCKETGCDTEWSLSNDHRLSDTDKYQQSARTAGIGPSDIRRAVASRTERTRQATEQSTHSMDISEWCHAWNRTRASSNALNPLTQQRKLLAWSYGENDSSPWTPVCTFISADEHLPAGADNPWTTWKALNRLRAQVGLPRVNVLKWGLSNEQETCGRHQADHATPTGLPHDGHCLLSPGHDNG